MARTPLPSDVRRVFREELDARPRVAPLSWLAFTTTVSGVRFITYNIKNGKGPVGHLSHSLAGTYAAARKETLG